VGHEQYLMVEKVQQPVDVFVFRRGTNVLVSTVHLRIAIVFIVLFFICDRFNL